MLNLRDRSAVNTLQEKAIRGTFITCNNKNFSKLARSD